MWQRSGVILLQVMDCCHQKISHYLNQCWLIIMKLRSSNIHLTVISQEIPRPPITKISLKITYEKFHLNLPGVNELTQWLHGTRLLDYAGYGFMAILYTNQIAYEQGFFHLCSTPHPIRLCWRLDKSESPPYLSHEICLAYWVTTYTIRSLYNDTTWWWPDTI